MHLPARSSPLRSSFGNTAKSLSTGMKMHNFCLSSAFFFLIEKKCKETLKETHVLVWAGKSHKLGADRLSVH